MDQLNTLLDTKFLVTKQMTDFFSEAGVLEKLMGYLTRVSPGIDFGDDANCLVQTDRPRSDSDALRRSYRLMEFFLQKSTHFEALVTANLDRILLLLSNVFHPSSEGSLFHWSKIFLSLLQKIPKLLAASMMANPTLFERMLPHIHESPVGDALVHFVSYPQFENSDRALVWNWLESERILERLFEICTCLESDFGARQGCDTLARIVDRIAVLPGARRAAKMLYGVDFIAAVVKSITTTRSKSSCHVAEAATELLCRLLAKSEEKLMDSRNTNAPPAEMPNFFASHRDELVNAAVDQVEALVDALFLTRNEDRLPNKSELASGVDSNARFDLLTPLRSLLVESLSNICRARPGAVLSKIVPAVWKTLIGWCLEHPEANIFHTNCNVLISMLIQTADEATQKNALQKSKILHPIATTAFEMLQREPGKEIQSSFYGFISLIVSLFILEAMKRSEGSYLYAVISVTNPWPELRTLCMQRALLLGKWKTWHDIDLPSPSAGAQMTNRNSHLGILPFVSPQMQHTRGSPPDDAVECYAWLLGYGASGWEKSETPIKKIQIDPPATDNSSVSSKSKNKNKNKSNNKKKKKKK